MANVGHMAAEAMMFWQAASAFRAMVRARAVDRRKVQEVADEIEVVQQYIEWPLLKARCEQTVKEAACVSSV